MNEGKAVEGLKIKLMGKYSHINFRPPESVRNAYKRGLELHEEGKTGKGLEASTVAMARKLADGQAVSPEWARKGNRFWARNERFLDEPKDSPAYTSAMLWGGRAGMGWFRKLYKQLEAADDMKANYVQVINQVNTASIRIERDDNNDEIIIVPSYTMPDDVVMNRIMYPKEEIERSYRGLEGVPAPIGHPHDSEGNFVSASSEIGINRFHGGVFNGRVEKHDGRIYVEKRINVRVAGQTDKGRQMLRRVRDVMDGIDDQPIHTSTGIFIQGQELPQTRVCDRGNEYDQIARNMVFDHDAILLDEEGAATPSQGVGMMVNKGESTSVLRVNLSSVASTGRTSYNNDANEPLNEADMALKDMLLGFLKANKVDVAEDASESALIEHLNAMKVNEELVPEQVDFDKLIGEKIDEKLKVVNEKLDALDISAVVNAEMDKKAKAELVKKLKDNGYDEDKIANMTDEEMEKAAAKMKANQSAEFTANGFQPEQNSDGELFTNNLADWGK